MIDCDDKLLRLMSEISREADANASLRSLAPKSGWSRAHLQRRFKAFAGESPKKFVQRVRLDRAAARLVSSSSSVLEVALDAGFDSHEVFTRAFARRFGRSPQAFRKAVRLPPAAAARAAEIVEAVSPCVGLYRLSFGRNKEKPMPSPIVERRVIEQEQPILFIQRRIPASALQPTMAECFGALYVHGQSAGLAMAGLPLARYISTGPGLWTVDFAMPVAQSAQAAGEMQAGFLTSGPVAFAVHRGPYEGLPDTNAAIQLWIEKNGYTAAGPPWEWYVTSPGDLPDPADWRTEVFWPLQS
jgi:AraC family transcriptional regulator